MKKFFFLLLLCSIAIPILAEFKDEMDESNINNILQKKINSAEKKGIQVTSEEINIMYQEFESKFSEKNASHYKDYTTEELENKFGAKEQEGTLFIPMNKDDNDALTEQEKNKDIQITNQIEKEFESTYEFERRYGNDNLFSTNINGNLTQKGNEQSVELNHKFAVTNYVLGRNLPDAFELELDIKNEKKECNQIHTAPLTIKIFGNSIWKGDFATKGKTDPFYKKKDYQHMFCVGPLLVFSTATLTLEGHIEFGYPNNKNEFLGIVFNPGFYSVCHKKNPTIYPDYSPEHNLFIHGKITPNVTLKVSFDNNILNAVGTKATLTLLNIRIPFMSTVQFIPQNNKFKHDLLITYSLIALDGKLHIYAKNPFNKDQI